jgi:hypothetical protein
MRAVIFILFGAIAWFALIGGGYAAKAILDTL